MPPKPLSPIATFSSSNSLLFSKNRAFVRLEKSLSVNGGNQQRRRRREVVGIVVASSTNVAARFWDGWKPDKGSTAPSLSDIVWPSAGAFAAMAVLGRMDQLLAPRGLFHHNCIFRSCLCCPLCHSFLPCRSVCLSLFPKRMENIVRWELWPCCNHSFNDLHRFCTPTSCKLATIIH